VGEVGLDALDRVVGGGLDVLLKALGLVLGELGLLDLLEHVAADVADVDAAFLGEAVGGFHELEAALLGEVGEGEADEVAVDDGVDADVGLLEGFFDGAEEALVPGCTWIMRGSGVVMAAQALSACVPP
jgi:hypothetical protein